MLSLRYRFSPVIRKSRLSNAPKRKSNLRVSFGPGQGDGDDSGTQDGASDTNEIGSSNPVRKIASSSLPKHSWSPSRTLEKTGPRIFGDSDRPSYSRDHLNELRNSTPSTPRDLSSNNSEDEFLTKSVDVISKFGATGADLSNSIPTDAEIREKKERRARLAKQQDFISLDDDGEQYAQLSTWKKPKETRLVRDDEDLAEGFDDFVDDPGRVALGRKAKMAQQKKERAAMRDMIADAEDITGEDDSEAERNLAYETAQTRNAMDGLGLGNTANSSKRTPPTVITPIPRLSSVLARLRAKISEMEATRDRLSRQMADLQQEKAEAAVRAIDIQRLVREAGENYERLSMESRQMCQSESSAIKGGEGP
jgi:hypothetical protein